MTTPPVRQNIDSHVASGLRGGGGGRGTGGTGPTTVTISHTTDTYVGGPLTSWWKLDETGTGTTAIDSGLAKTNATDQAGSTTASTAAPTVFTNPGARHFTGNTGLSAGTQAAHALNNNFTVSAWVRPSSFTNVMGILTRQSNQGGWCLSTTNSPAGQFVFQTYNGTTKASATSNQPLTTNVWTHVLGVVRSGTLYAYVKGARQTTTATQTISAPNINTVIGYYQTDIPTSRWTGDIDDVRIYNVALSDDQISSLGYGNEPFQVTPTTRSHGTDSLLSIPILSYWKLDETGTGTTAIDYGTARLDAADDKGTTTPSTTAPVGAPLHFTNPSGRFFPSTSGTCLFTTFDPVYNLTQNFTVAAWVRCVGRTSNQPFVTHHVTNASGSTAGEGWGLMSDGSGRLGAYAPSPDGALNELQGEAAFTLQLNVWTHIAFVVSTSARYLYFNGRRSVNSSSVMPISLSTMPTLLGKDYDDITFYQFNGDLDDVRIYGFALTDDQMQSLAGGNDLRQLSVANRVHGTDSFLIGQLVSYWPLDEIGTGKTAIDVTPLGANATDQLGLTVNSTLAPVAAPVSFTNPTGRRFVNTDHDYLAAASLAAHNFTGDFTVSAWVRCVGSANGIPIVVHRSQSSYVNGWALLTNSFGALQSWVAFSATAYIITSEFVLPVGTWVHTCMTFTGQSHGPRAVYFNGRKSVNSLASGQMPGSNQLPTTFGRDYTDTGTAWLNGDLDEIRFYRSGLSDDQVQSLAVGNDPFLVTRATISHTTDVLLIPVVVVTRTQVHTTDMVHRGTSTIAHTSDMLHNGVFTRTHTTGSYLRATFARTHTTNTLCRGTSTLTHTINSLVRSTSTRTYATDTSRRGTLVSIHTTGSLVQDTSVLIHSSSTTMRGEVTWVHGTNSWLYKGLLRSPGYRSMMAIWLGGAVRQTMIAQTVHATDATLVYCFDTSHGSDVSTRGTILRSHTADALVSRVVTVSVSQTTDTDLKGPVTRAHKTSSLVYRTSTKLHTDDTMVRLTPALVYSTDSQISHRVTQQQAHVTDADLSGHAIQYHLINSLVRSTNVHAHGSDVAVHFTFACVHSTDSRLAALGIQLQVHATDADLKGAVTRAHTTSALAYITPTKVHTMDTKAVNTYIRTHTTDSLRRHPITQIHTTDTGQRRAYLRGHTTNSRLAGTRAAVHSTDAGFSYVAMVNGQTDVLVRDSLLRQHTTDIKYRWASIRAHSTSSWCQILPMRSHFTDTSKLGSRHLPNYTDWLARGTIIRAHTTDLWYCNIVVTAHSTDAIRKGERTRIYKTDSVASVPYLTSHSTDTLPLVVPAFPHSTDVYVAHTKSWSHLTWSLITRVPIAGRWTTPRVGTRPMINVVSKNRQEAGNLYPIGFLLVGFDRITPILDAKPTVQLLTPGGIWVPAVGAVTEVTDGSATSNGWYQLALDPADCPVTGEYVLMATDPNAEVSWTKFDVVVPDPYASITLSVTERNVLADVTLTRAFASAASAAKRSVIQAVRALWQWKTAQAKPITVVAEDGTIAWQANVTTDPTIPPIRGMDPYPPGS
jgi:Concanavalin A-like lectin/glucanases superfamily